MEAKEKYTLNDLVDVVSRLRGEDGCPWDRKQTHETLIPCMEEECAEAVDAIRKQDMENLQEELGDVLLQVVMHAQIGAEEGNFEIGDVIDGVCRKMIRRHPHVFGNAVFSSEEEQKKYWNEIKEMEKRERNQ
ncbi:MAG TPA: MazG family protein [Candidatus Anaerostipes avistercoris]|uniref:MazG family protein n=1 Tax=Candidatus Anaerostipes avistercoris TaxID=2838462 RepID=A0A9D2PJB8_9FIRM|nr:MazG family protein [uncultured Anaerostipes sp.]HJC50289.1 MazG family protein [Candidatus Anaerostipes avistercoris]